MRFRFLSVLLLGINQVSAKAVFAHFMVGNVATWTVDNWKSDIGLAQDAHIDAFALNIAYNDSTVAASLSLAFQAANAKSFKLFFSFDYAGGGPWPKGDVINYLTEYASNGAYFHTEKGQPFVSTFEGPQNATDWTAIKAQINPQPFLVPDWSSLGAGPALALNQADGLFNWNAWPFGDSDSNTYVDAAYRQVLGNVSEGGKPYMMPVSPWFFTNMPGYDKNWLWRGDDLWYDRWQQVLYVQPEYVEIISWNDYGESHYIGPLDAQQYTAFGSTTGKSPYNYAEQYPHDGWRRTLPFVIDTYKTGSATVTEEILTAWSRSTPAKSSCSVNGTTANTASQLQFEYNPAAVAQDKIFYTALLTSAATSVLVNIGGSIITGGFDHTPSGKVGLYHGSVSFSGLEGPVYVVLQRGGVSLGQVQLAPIGNNCDEGIQNWNAFVGATSIGQVTTNNKASINGYTCVKGTSVPDFADLCEFTCGLGYCPIGACLCTALGPLPVQPKSTGVKGYPAADMNHDYDGLCNVACNLGHCPSQYCGTASVEVPTPTISPFEPLACTSGTGSGDFKALCEYTCRVGYCPIAMCTCLTRGTLNQPVAANNDKGYYLPEPMSMAYNDICTFVCSRKYCISPCSTQNPSTAVCTSGVGDGSCSYGFCPEPCTCLGKGAQVTPPTIDQTLTGYASLGLDIETYGPLCNFTCSHGYCPTGSCVEKKDLDPSDIPSDTSVPGLLPYTTIQATYSAGDLFTYTSSEDSDLSLDIILAGTSTTLKDSSCDIVVPGVHGGALGCIAEVVEFLLLSIFDDPYALQARDTTTDDFNYNLEVHSDWTPSGNCSTHCALRTHAPLHTWTPVGNGTYNGTYHELRFLNTGKTIGYSALRVPRTQSNVTARSIHGRGIGAWDASMYFSDGDFANFKDFGYDVSNSNPRKRIMDLYAVGAEESAIQGYYNHCDVFKYKHVVETLSAVVINDDQTSTFSSEDADNTLSNCITEESEPRPYAIFAVYPFDVDDISDLLASFPDTNLEEHMSVGKVYAICTDDCEDPDEGFKDILEFNSTDHSAFEKRSRIEGTVETLGVTADVAFVSQQRGASVVDDKNLVFDSTGGEGVRVYVLETSAFDLTLPEFNTRLDSNGLSLAQKAVAPVLVGTLPFTPPSPDISHANGMLAQVAGDEQGIARYIIPALYNWNLRKRDKYAIIQALDAIHHDFLTRNNIRSDIAELGVLSMSFGYTANSDTDDLFDLRFSNALNKLVSIGVIPITSAGNEGGAIAKVPAIFGDPTNAYHVPGLLVVGGLENTGLQWASSDSASYVQTWAPASAWMPYRGASGQQFSRGFGTSAACAKTAGLAAYFIGLPSLKSKLTNVQALVDFIQLKAWPRAGSTLSGICNRYL